MASYPENYSQELEIPVMTDQTSIEELIATSYLFNIVDATAKNSMIPFMSSTDINSPVSSSVSSFPDCLYFQTLSETEMGFDFSDYNHGSTDYMFDPGRFALQDCYYYKSAEDWGAQDNHHHHQIAQIIEAQEKVERCSVEEKKEKILRYLKKRNQRNFNKTIKYACRKTLADKRVRIRGRFAKNNEPCENENEVNAITETSHEKFNTTYNDSYYLQTDDEWWFSSSDERFYSPV